MEDASISKLYSKDFGAIPSLCRYDITVTRKGGRKVLLDTELSQTVILTRLVVAGQAIRVERCRPSVKAGASNRCEIGNFFPIPSPPISFAIYIGFKKPRQEGTLLEAKFQQSQFAEGGFTWDIVCNTYFQDEFHVSLEVHLLSASPLSRIDISHDSKTRTTSLHLLPSSESSSEASGAERQFLQKLVDSPPSKARTDALLLNGLSLCAQFERTNDAEYLDFSIQALFPCRPYIDIDIRTRPRCERRLYIIHILFSHLLFIRCTLPDGDAFVHEAFGALKAVNIFPAEDNGFLEPFVRSILLVLERHNCPDHRTSAFSVIGPSISFLQKNGFTPKFQFNSVPLLASQIMVETKEDLYHFDHLLPLIAPHLSAVNYGELLMNRAMSYLRFHEAGDIGRDRVVTAIGSVQTHFLDHCGTEMKLRETVHAFLLAAGVFFIKTIASGLWRTEGFGIFLTSCLTFLDWGIPVELKMELEGTPLHLKGLKAEAQRVLWMVFHHAVEGRDELAETSRFIREVIQVVYSERLTVIGDGLVEIMHNQMMDLALGIVRASPVHGPTETMEAIIEYSLSEKPHDHISMIRVIFAATISRTVGSPAAMKAYHLLMSSAELLDWTWLMSQFRHHHPMTAPSITSDAISCASDLDCYELAVEWADRCSSMAWNRVIHFRSPFTQVATIDPQLAEKLTNLASKLLTLPPAVVDHTPDDHLHYTTCVRDWRDTVREARKLPGLDGFSAPNTFSEIQSAVNALGGPVVFFNISRFSSYALCVVPNLDDVVPIPLTRLNPLELDEVSTLFRHLLDGTGNEEIKSEGPLRSRIGKLVKNHKLKKYVGVPLVLEYLWLAVVKPVLDGLAIPRSESQSAEKLPRIWWCPCGPLETFPFHAAGFYDNGNKDNAMNYVVSSYIPSSVLASHVTRAEVGTRNPQVLAVANPAGSRLPGTEKELELIRKHLVGAGPVTELVGGNVTPDAVKQGLHAATWAHFACHGVQVDVDEPGMTCSLTLANHEQLTLAEISRLSLPHARFAFLSACETALERRICAGESVHIAAGMLVAGFRSVIGTMWRISDEYAPDLADLFYQKMFEGTHAGQIPDHRRSAYALHDAVKEFRERGVGFKVWVPFLHYGA